MLDRHILKDLMQQIMSGTMTTGPPAAASAANVGASVSARNNFIRPDVSQCAIRCDLWQAVPVSQAKQKRLIQPLDQKLFVSRYLTALPSAEQLKNFLERDRTEIKALITELK